MNTVEASTRQSVVIGDVGREWWEYAQQFLDSLGNIENSVTNRSLSQDAQLWQTRDCACFAMNPDLNSPLDLLAESMMLVDSEAKVYVRDQPFNYHRLLGWAIPNMIVNDWTDQSSYSIVNQLGTGFEPALGTHLTMERLKAMRNVPGDVLLSAANPCYHLGRYVPEQFNREGHSLTRLLSSAKGVVDADAKKRVIELVLKAAPDFESIVLPLPINPFDRLEQAQPEWVQRIKHLMELQSGWDGFGAEPIAKQAVNRSLQILTGVIDIPDSLSGRELFIAPLPDGGLELDWNFRLENDLMIMIPPEGEPVEFLLTLIDDTGNEKEREGILGADDTIAQLFSVSAN